MVAALPLYGYRGRNRKSNPFWVKKEVWQNDCKENNTLDTTIARANAESISAVEPELPLNLICEKSNDYNYDKMFEQIKEKSKLGKEWREIILILAGLSIASHC